MNPIITSQDSVCTASDPHFVDEKRAIVVDLSTKSSGLTPVTHYSYPYDQANIMKLPFNIPAPPPPTTTTITTTTIISPCATPSTSRAANHISKPLGYCTPNPVPNLPENNQVRLLEYRGAQLAAFTVDGRDLVCLPQAFELFLKHLVGGLHTVYTKLKRLEIAPVVCNVEQVRILRGLGAIQPGVNRCKLIAPNEFDVLYADCTNSSARPGRPSKRISTVSSPGTISPVGMSGDNQVNGQYGNNMKEPATKLPRKLFPSQACLTKSSTLSRLTAYQSVPMPYSSALASLCLNSENMGRLFTETEPFIQAMNGLSNAFTPPSNTLLSYAPPRMPFLPDLGTHISTTPNVYTESERLANCTLIGSHPNRVHSFVTQEQNDTRQKISCSTEILNKRPSPVFTSSKTPIPHTVRRLTTSESGQSPSQSKTPTSEMSINTTEDHSIPSDHQNMQTTLSDWLKTSTIIPPLKSTQVSVHNTPPFPLYHNNPIFCSTPSSHLGIGASATVNEDSWMIHSKRLIEHSAVWAELASRWKLPMPLLFPVTTTGFTSVPSTSINQFTGLVPPELPTTTTTTTEVRQGDSLMTARKFNQTELSQPHTEPTNCINEKSSKPEFPSSNYKELESGKDKNMQNDEFRACFDSMFYRLLETYYQMTHLTKPPEPTPGNIPTSAISEANSRSEQTNSVSQSEQHLCQNTNTLFAPFSDCTASDSCLRLAAAAHGSIGQRTAEYRSNSPDSRKSTPSSQPEKLNDENCLSMSGAHSVDRVAKTESSPNGNSQNGLDDQSSSRRPMSDCAPNWSEFDPFLNTPSTVTAQHPEAHPSAINRDLSVRHYQWLQFMVKSFMANCHSGASIHSDQEVHKQGASTECRNESGSS